MKPRYEKSFSIRGTKNIFVEFDEGHIRGFWDFTDTI